jgi:copper chaperone
MTTLKIQGMTCMHCVKAVTQALAAVPGVSEVTAVSLEQAQATVAGTAAPEALVVAVKNAGYQAHVAS